MSELPLCHLVSTVTTVLDAWSDSLHWDVTWLPRSARKSMWLHLLTPTYPAATGRGPLWVVSLLRLGLGSVLRLSPSTLSPQGHRGYVTGRDGGRTGGSSWRVYRRLEPKVPVTLNTGTGPPTSKLV